MNREAILAVADVIEYADRLNLRHFAARPAEPENWPTHSEVWDDCGTTACIAGWVAAWSDYDPESVAGCGFVENMADEFGIPQRQAERLAYGWTGLWPDDLTDSKAVAQLLRDIANGVVVL